MVLIPAEIISTGRELLIGKTVNTNASWIAAQLISKGIAVSRITSVDDNVDAISGAISEAIARNSSIIVITGGLGPTYDDLTSEGLASALRLPREVNPEALGQVRAKYVSMGLPITPARIKMANLPVGAYPIINPLGTAPGILAVSGRSTIYALPGVPTEMRAMFSQTILPAAASSAEDFFSERSLTLEGIPESSLSPILDNWRRSNPWIYIKSHPRGKEAVPTLEMHLSAMGKDLEALASILDRGELSLMSMVQEAGGQIKRNNQ